MQYGSKHNQLAAIEGYLKQLLETLGVESANNLVADPIRGKSTNSHEYNVRRRKKLLRTALRELRRLDEEDDDDNNRAFSQDTSTWTDSQQAAYDAMCSAMRLRRE
jgi:hypothetical protein